MDKTNGKAAVSTEWLNRMHREIGDALQESVPRSDAERRLGVAQEVAAFFDERCKEAGIHPDPEVLVLAIYASTSVSERSALFVGGLK